KDDRDLFDVLRAGGIRKKVAESVSNAADKTGAIDRTPKVVKNTARDLRSLASELEDRMKGSPKAKRQAAAKKAARKRKQKERRRSEAARKAARTRARS